MPQTCLYRGEVMHRRLRPFGHRFVYGVASLLVDLDDLSKLRPSRGLRLLSHNRFNLFAIHDRDHGPRDGSPLRPWVEAELRAAGIDLREGAGDGGRIFLHCLPRLLGYVFNPISIYWCYGADGRLRAVLCEVKNTFGEQCSYVLSAPSRREAGAPLRASCAKKMYVSPFIAMAGRYRFRLDDPEAVLKLVITESDRDGALLVASHSAARRALDDRALLGAFAAFPFLTAKVIAAIHWQALRLWLKGARIEPYPAAQSPKSSAPQQGESGVQPRDQPRAASSEPTPAL
jgi:DUF1365 family protein